MAYYGVVSAKRIAESGYSLMAHEYLPQAEIAMLHKERERLSEAIAKRQARLRKIYARLEELDVELTKVKGSHA